MYLDRVKQQFEQGHLAAADEIHPCTQEEVQQLETEAGRPLPAAYREFLLWMGHGAGPFLQGTDAFYQDLPGMREDAVALLQENGIREPLPGDAFVFYMHQGYQFMYFRTSEGDDPPIYYFSEGDKEGPPLRMLYESFSDFLARTIAWYVELDRGNSTFEPG